MYTNRDASVYMRLLKARALIVDAGNTQKRAGSTNSSASVQNDLSIGKLLPCCAPDNPPVPSSPTNVIATVGNGRAIISFTMPNDSTITGYKVISSPATSIITGLSSPITFTGLTNGVSYTFTVIAVNSVGDSVASSASNAVTPSAPAPRTAGLAKLAASMYDNANDGHIAFGNVVEKVATDSSTHIIVAGVYRADTLTLTKPDTNGITQIATLTETFDGLATAIHTTHLGSTTYYTGNIYVAKYSPAGIPVWSAKISGSSNNATTLYNVACDSQNNIYAYIGVSWDSALGPNVISFYNSDDSVFATKGNAFGFGKFSPARYFLIKYNASGVIQWVNSITAGDNNNQFVLAIAGDVAVDGLDNVYITTQLQRAGGGTGPSSVKFYKHGVTAGALDDALATSDSFPFTAEYHRGHLVKLNSAGTYSWIARMVVPSAYGENNGGGRNGNIAIDGNNNVYVCQNVQVTASSPICNIYSGVAASSNPLPAVAAPYYRYDLRGNSISPSLPQFYVYSAVVKFNSSGIFQGLCGAHQLRNSSVALDMTGYVEINKETNEIYMTVNAQGFAAVNSGISLDKLYIDSFSSNSENASNFDIDVVNTITVPLAQPQTILAVVKFNDSLQAVAVTYVDTPGGNAGTASGFNQNGKTSPLAIDSNGNVYVATTIKNNTDTKTIKTFASLSGSTPTFNTFGTIDAADTSADGLIFSYDGDLTTGRWASLITSSDGLNDTNFVCKVNSDDYIFLGGNATLNKAAASNTVGINSYTGVTDGEIQNTLLGNMVVTNATDRAGFLVKYE